jgi:type I restriction enzyme S subunit
MSTRASLNNDAINSIEIKIPEIEIQEKIGSILKSLDDKIELNRRMNQTLEQMAQALFNHYFVDNIDPDNLPEGWRIGKLGDYIQTVSKTHSFQKPEIIFLNTSDISEGNVLHSKYSPVEGLPGQAKKSIKQNDILFSEIRPANKRYAFINFDAEDYVVSTKLMVLRSKSNIDSLFFYFLLTQEQTLVYLQNIAESRSGTFPQITFDQVKEIEFVIPTEEFLKQFIERTLKPTFELIFNNEKESKSLSTIRDTLLPKLLSGEIDVHKK